MKRIVQIPPVSNEAKCLSVLAVFGEDYGKYSGCYWCGMVEICYELSKEGEDRDEISKTKS